MTFLHLAIKNKIAMTQLTCLNFLGSRWISWFWAYHVRAICSLRGGVRKKKSYHFHSLFFKWDVLISCIAQENFNMLSDHLFLIIIHIIIWQIHFFLLNHIEKNDMEGLGGKHRKKGFVAKVTFSWGRLLNYSRLFLQFTRQAEKKKFL